MPTLEQLRREVCEANLGVWRGGLVTMHSGNASGIDRKRGLVMIKPSGMDYDRMRPADMVVTDLEAAGSGASGTPPWTWSITFISTSTARRWVASSTPTR